MIDSTAEIHSKWFMEWIMHIYQLAGSLIADDLIEFVTDLLV